MDFDRGRSGARQRRASRPEAARRAAGRSDWEYLAWLALDASAAVLGEHAEQRGVVVSYGGEAFTAGFLIGVHLHERPVPEPREADGGRRPGAGTRPPRGDRRPLRSGERRARSRTSTQAALVESLDVADADGRRSLRSPLTRIFEAGLAVGLELGSGGDGDAGAE